MKTKLSAGKTSAMLSISFSHNQPFHPRSFVFSFPAHRCVRLSAKSVLFVLLLFFGIIAGCAGSGYRTVNAGGSLLSPQIQEKVRRVVSSVVGVTAIVDYRIEFFYHEMTNGKFIPDAKSPTGYRLSPAAPSSLTSKKIQKVNGGGLIIHSDGRHTLILTSQHILAAPDTIKNFYRDNAGNPTNVLFSRAIKTRTTYHVTDQNNQPYAAEVISADARTDLGLVTVPPSPTLGIPFPNVIAYRTEVKWGDWAFVFGYPREIKQLSVGVVSPAPYPGTFALDVVARFGFSGGPVFVVRPEGELELAGIIRGVPVSKLQYIAPPPEVLPGQNLTAEELAQIRAEEYDLIEYGTVYAVGAERIGRFLKESNSLLEKKGIYLPERFFPED